MQPDSTPYRISMALQSRSESPHRPRSRSRSPVRDTRRERRYDDEGEGGSSRQKDDSSYRGNGYDNRRRERSRDRYRDRDGKRRRSRSRSRDRHDEYSRQRDRARDRSSEYRRPRSKSRSRSPSGPSRNAGRSTGPLPSQNAALANAGIPSGSSKYGKRANSRSPSPSAEAIEASKPNFKNSGALAAETNTFKGVVLKYNEPPEARKPNKGWRLYVFKGQEQVDMIMVGRQSAYLFGRDRVVADIPLEHPSASKQHAVLQYRAVHERSEFGETKTVTKPYIIDLESANGTTVNGEKIPASRYYELMPNDVVKFAYSTREYVVIVD